MKKSHLIRTILSLGLVICILAGSMDWSFFDAAASMEESVDDTEKAADDSDMPADTGTDKEEVPAAENPDMKEPVPDSPDSDIKEPLSDVVNPKEADDLMEEPPVTEEVEDNLEEVPPVTEEVEDNLEEVPPVTEEVEDNLEEVPLVTEEVKDNLEEVPPVTEETDLPDDKTPEPVTEEEVSDHEMPVSTVSDATDEKSVAEEPVEEEEAYAILYSDNTLVFQRGNIPDESHGDVTEIWSEIETKNWSQYAAIPWISYKTLIKSVIVKDRIRPVSCFRWFQSFTECDFFDLSLLDTGNVTDMGYMFYGCSALQTLDLSGFDTGNVTDMGYMFYGCSALQTLDLSGFNTGKVWYMEYMFKNCSALQTLDLSGFDTGKVTDMRNMFNDCSALQTLDLSGFNTSNVTDMGYMFYGCSALQTLDLSGFNTSKVSGMSGMFKNCSALQTLDLSGFDTSNVINMSSMFFNCGSLQTLDLSGFDTDKVKNMGYLFYRCSTLQTLDLSGFNTGNVADMRNMFYGCSALQTLDLSGFNTGKITSMVNMFYGCPALQTLDLSSFDTSNVTDMSSMFFNCGSLQTLDLSGFNTGKVRYMECMFGNCTSLQTLDLSGFDTRNVTSMRCMFDDCRSLQVLDLSSFDTSNVTSMGYMFSDCRSLQTLDLSGFDTNKVKNMEYMFRDCRSLQTLDLSGFDTGNVTNMESMFEDCRSLQTLDLSSFDTGNVTDMESMFRSCQSLQTFDLSSFHTGNVTNMKYLFYGCRSLQTLDISGFDVSKIASSHAVFTACDMLCQIRFGSGIKSDKKQILNFDIFYGSWINVDTGTVYDNLYEDWSGEAGLYNRMQDIVFDSVYSGTQIISNYIGATIDRLPDAPDLPVRYFDGWFTQKEGGEQLLPGSTLTQTRYYAHWTDYRYTLVLKPNGGDGEDITITCGYYETVRLPDAGFSWPGKKFTGWNTRKDGSGTAYAPKDFVRALADGDQDIVTLYAQYDDSDTMVTVTFETDGGIPVPPITVVSGTTITPLSASKEGYTFRTWTRNINSTDVFTRFLISEDTVLYAQWYKNPKITFDMQGYGENLIRTVPYNEALGTLPSCPTGTGRYQSLIGWFTEPEGGTPVSSNQKILRDTVFYAHFGWKPEFDTAGGMFVNEETFPIQEGSPVYLISKLPEVRRDGYTFDGWYLKNSREPLSDGCSIDLSEGIVIEAHWTQKEAVTVTFEANGGRVNSNNTYTISCYKGEPLLSFPNITTKPSRYLNGYGTTYASFLGWMDDSGQYYTKLDTVTEDLTLTAQWQYMDVILTFDADGGSGISGTGVSSGKMCLPSGTSLFTLPGAKKTNYVLEGWYTEKNGKGEKLTTDTIITKSGTYYANWAPFFLSGSDTSSLYVYGAEWSNASNTNVTNLDNTLEFHPSSNTSQTASLHIRFELNRSIESGKDLVIPVGAVKIRVPKHIWKNWNGQATGSNNLSANLPKYPAVRNGMYFSYMEDGDDYILINSEELSGTAGLDLTISYTVTPSNVPGGASDVNGRYLPEYEFYKGDVPVRFSVDADLNEEPESEMTKELSVEMHTGADISCSKTGSVYYTWSSAWGEKPADADDYFYVSWTIPCSTKGIQAISDYTLSEDSVHDGTVIRMNNVYNVITKHPMSLLKNIPSSGLTLTNTACLQGIMQSGCPVTAYAKGSVRIHQSSYPTGEYTKHNTISSTSAGTRTGGQELILEDNKNVQLDWQLSYSGSSNKVPQWNEDLGTYLAEKRTIRIRDGVHGDVMYSSGTAASKYVWEPETGNVVLTDDDYYFSGLTFNVMEYDSRYADGAWTSVFGNRDFSLWDDVDLYVRYAGSDEFVYYDHYRPSSSTRKIIFNRKDIVGFEIRHDSDYYKTQINVIASMQLKPTNHIRLLLQDDVNAKATSIIKNSSVCDIWTTEKGESSIFFHAVDNTGGMNPANKNCYELNVSTTRQYTIKFAGSQSSVVFDVMRGTQDSPMQIHSRNYNTGGRKKLMNAGIFYDLLPEGTSVDPDTVVGIPITGNSSSVSNKTNNYTSYKNSTSRIDPGYYDVRFVQNWENSGRTMMIIKYGLPRSYTNVTGMEFYYLLHNTYENVMEHGTSVENDVAFVNLTENRMRPDSISGTLSTITQKMYYQSLEDANSGNIGYEKANTNYIPVDAYSWGFHKSVQTVSEYEHLGEVLPNSLYTYRLVYSQSEYATSRDLVFFDVLEAGSETKGEDGQVQKNESEWHGVLQYVNTGAASSKLTDGSSTVHLKPVVWYSTKDRDLFTGEDFTLSNTKTWTTEKPADLSTITAVAIDCSKNEDGSDFVMKGKQSLEMYITLKSPMEVEHADHTAYNEGVIWARHENDDESTPEYDNAAVIIRDVEPGIHKTSDPESGTEDAPADVYEDDALVYTLSVSNENEKFTLNDIVLTDTVPEGLSLDTGNIRVHFGDPENAVNVSVSPRVSMTRRGRTLTFTVSSLLPGETMYLEIPTVVLVDHGILTNTAEITSVNGVAKSLHSETTWHEAQPTGMAVQKTGVGGLAIEGAVLQLLDMEGTVLYEWTSSTHTEHFEMKPGDYVIHEVSAPDGYLVADDIAVNLSRTGVMTLKSDGSVASPVLMSDDWTKVTIRKENPDGELLPGAELSIYRSEDVTDGVPNETAEPVLAFTSGEEAHVLSGVLKAGATYVLVETAAPEDYVIADPVTFTVADDGSEQTVVMTDLRDGVDVTIRKVDEDHELLAGALLKIVRLTEDMQPDDTLEPFTWTSDGNPHTVKLEPGQYLLQETEAPTGYTPADDLLFTVTDDGRILVSDTEQSELVLVNVRQEYELSILKQVKGNLGDKTQDFTFRLVLTEGSLFPISDTLSVYRSVDEGDPVTETVTLTDGGFIFTLAHGERITLVLPYGTEYEVTELDGESLGYQVEGVNIKGSLTDSNMAASFINTRNGGIPTGFVAYTMAPVGFASVCGLFVLLYRCRRSKEKEQ